jgi:predicted transcriptional regulator
MYYQRLSDEEILRGFRQGDSSIISEYFYGYCRVGYNIFNKKYQLSDKENLDFMSLAHQYALYLMEHDWKPLENRSANVSLKTWLINGFRYVVLDALKWHRKEYGSIPFNDYLLTFDVTNDLRQQFNKTVEELCNHAALSRDERIIIDMLLLQGFKSYEIAAQMGMTPSAISQKYVKLKKNIIEPYFKKHFDMDLDMPEVFDETAVAESKSSIPMPKGLGDYMKKSLSPLRFMKHDKQQERSSAHTSSDERATNQQKRTTPEFITQLQPNEIFVFGSNLKGMHGGGAAYIAYRKFGAVMGQGVGLQGQSYAIPTMQGGVETIRPYVDEFILFARQHPEMTFLVTRIGCGIAGFTDREISPLFEQAHDVENIVLPRGW